MRCPECEKEGEKSLVYADGSMMTAVYLPPFYDEEGRYHHHDPNSHSTTFTCSLGHKWSESKVNKCWCGWPDEERDIMIHELADVEEGAVIGDGTKVWRWTHIMPGAQIGENCSIGEHCYIGGKVVIGNGCRIQNGAQIFDGVTLGDNVFVGPGVKFSNVKRPRAFQKGEYEDTLVKEGATLGLDAKIICGVTIGEYAFVGAGSVVTKDVPDYGKVYGNPAILHGYVAKSGIDDPLRIHEYEELQSQEALDDLLDAAKGIVPDEQVDAVKEMLHETRS